MNERHHTLFFPLVLIAAGVIWLLVNFGYVPSANLWALTYIWPFLLIGLGAGLILRNYWAEAGILISALLVIGAVAAVIYAPQLGWADSPAGWGWHWNWYAGGAVRGSGNVETETRQLGAFGSINVRYPADIFIQQGENESVSITADDNLLPQLGTEVISGTLTIDNTERSRGRRVNASETVQITLIVQDMSEITFDSAGSIKIDGLSGGSLAVTLRGAGNITLMNVTLDELEVRIEGAGSMDASGIVGNLVVRIDGLGSLNAADLASQTANMTVNGLGSATIRVEQDLEVRIDGLGSVNYYGSPEVREQVDGLGSVKHIDD
ncbi:MAG TPA: DUF2807 domain-containing protein [Anaerolineales bacterium]|nr:DUF2807 domain-containing protein [Anaerolineales bacterium]